jgi:hypothetical protein
MLEKGCSGWLLLTSYSTEHVISRVKVYGQGSIITKLWKIDFALNFCEIFF